MKQNILTVHIEISPNASKNEIVPFNDSVKIKITAQPIENKANKALIEFLSKYFSVPKSKIKITKGLTSKNKTIEFDNITVDKKNEILSALKISV